MNTHALAVLEFHRVLEVVAERATSGEGAERVRRLRPTTETGWIDREQARVFATRALIASDARWAPYAIPAAGRALERLRVENALLGAADFMLIRALLRSSRLTLESLSDPRLPIAARAVLQPLTSLLVKDVTAEGAIDSVLDDEGEVRDSASPRLRGIRRELRHAESDLVALLERLMARLDAAQQVPDMSVTVRNGRYVIPVRREGRAGVGGIVHDASATGSTLFIEPPAAVEAGNRMRELAAEEAAEIERVLTELGESLRPIHPSLAAAFDALAELDSLYARGRMALEFGSAPVALRSATESFEIVDGRHPLLLAQGARVVPFDLTLSPAERTFLISGPNTGGKTVLIKAVALLSLCLQAGIPPTVGEGSSIAIYDEIFADIGDEQSIAASLSTFSAHVRNLREILSGANANSLVIIDELGSGTDPVEGAALGGAVLESLTGRGARTIATTHLGALKQLAVEDPGVVNGSLQFDAIELAPTYRLIKGIPGQSYGLSIARRLGVPPEVLERAERRLPAGERSVNELLADLEARDAALAAREREAATIAADARERARRVSEREQNAGVRERESERRAREEARRYLLSARREIENTIKSLKKSDNVEETASEARRHVEDLARQQTEGLDRLESRERAQRNRGLSHADAAPPVVGDYVAVASLGDRTGRLLEMRDGSAIVAVGTFKLSLPMSDLSRAARPEASPGIRIRGDIPEVQVASEIDLRGMRVGEVEDIVMHAVDNAVRADMKAIRIIHGKGTGALRERISEMLQKEPRVTNFRLGAWNEGGAGVTVVELA
ncbi:MAG: endonuclease MutS2 [Gemmatimonadota bacterium]|nr:endonuclease MutS2 [Gemmatimonadota bacterium]